MARRPRAAGRGREIGWGRASIWPGKKKGRRRFPVATSRELPSEARTRWELALVPRAFLEQGADIPVEVLKESVHVQHVVDGEFWHLLESRQFAGC